MAHRWSQGRLWLSLGPPGIKSPQDTEEPAVPADEVHQRRLAVILAADVAGYSRLMSQDEEATLNTLASYQEVIAGLIAEHHSY